MVALLPVKSWPPVVKTNSRLIGNNAFERVSCNLEMQHQTQTNCKRNHQQNITKLSSNVAATLASGECTECIEITIEKDESPEFNGFIALVSMPGNALSAELLRRRLSEWWTPKRGCRRSPGTANQPCQHRHHLETPFQEVPSSCNNHF